MPLRLLLHARDDNVTAATASADAAVAATDAVLAVAVVVICFFGAIIDENDAPRKSAPTAARSFTAHADDAMCMNQLLLLCVLKIHRAMA